MLPWRSTNDMEVEFSLRTTTILSQCRKCNLVLEQLNYSQWEAYIKQKNPSLLSAYASLDQHGTVSYGTLSSDCVGSQSADCRCVRREKKWVDSNATSSNSLLPYPTSLLISYTTHGAIGFNLTIDPAPLNVAAPLAERSAD